MKIHIPRSLIVLPLVLGFLIFSSLSYGQRTRVITGPTTNGCYRIPVTRISSAPPLHSDMSYQAILGYIYFDSLCRSFTSWHQMDSLFEQIQSFDTLKYFDALLYAMTEYDPILFQEFLQAGYAVNTSYTMGAGAILGDYFQKTRQVTRPVLHKHLVNADLILHIKITGIARDSDTMVTNPSPNLLLLCFTAQVLDTIKGKHFPMGCYDGPLCFQFSYSPLWNRRGGGSDYSAGPSVQDMYGMNFLSLDSEYIAFFSVHALDCDSSQSYYDIWPYASSGDELNGGFIPVDYAHKVHDTTNLLEDGTLVDEATFLATMRSDIYSLLHP
jgi:hypothetical protein